jgi:hypothetical protein
MGMTPSEARFCSLSSSATSGVEDDLEAQHRSGNRTAQQSAANSATQQSRDLMLFDKSGVAG